jgi:hypothetical protein
MSIAILPPNGHTLVHAGPLNLGSADIGIPFPGGLDVLLDLRVLYA